MCRNVSIRRIYIYRLPLTNRPAEIIIREEQREIHSLTHLPLRRLTTFSFYGTTNKRTKTRESPRDAKRQLKDEIFESNYRLLEDLLVPLYFVISLGKKMQLYFSKT